MTWSAVGSLIQPAGTTSFSLTPSAVGDLILIEIINGTGTGGGTASALSSSNVTWSTFGSSFTGTTNAGFTSQVFGGKVTSASTATVTITWSGTTPSAHVTIDGQEFSSTVGSWAFDTQGHIDSAGTSTWASLTPAGTGELYFGYARDNTNAAATCGTMPCTTGGFTYNADSNSNGLAYNLSVSAPAAAVWSDAQQAFGIMVLVEEQAAGATPGPPVYPRPSNRVVTVPFVSGRQGAGHSR